MAIGVTYDEFWHGDPDIVNYAIEVAEINQKQEAILSDISAWNTGRYVMLGVGVVLSQAFSRNSQAKYPSEPMLAYELDEQLAKQKRERELIKMRDDFLAVAAAMRVRNPIGEPAN